jgi:hypothetical protein
MRIFSSAEKCRRVARRMSLITCSADGLSDPVSFLFEPLLTATMNQKPSAPQLNRFVAWALTGDTKAESGRFQ